VSDAAVEAVRDAVRLDDTLTLHGTPAVRLAAHRRVRVRTNSANEALGAVRRARLDAVGGAAGGGER
jgi:antitoxin (DNA-binding transcriptional repressor) of toxin-antitoxin stability system